MWYAQLGSELTGFTDDTFCYVLFNVEQRTMKKIQAILSSCREQDNGSVKHSSVLFP